MGGNVCAGTDARASGATRTADTARLLFRTAARLMVVVGPRTGAPI
jgi:hypothetical protein